MLKWNSRHMTNRRVAEETGDHLKQLSLDLARLRRPTRWTVVLFRAHAHRYVIHNLWRSYERLLKHRDRIFQHFFTKIDTNLFLRDFQIVQDPTRTNLFTAKCSCNVECRLVEKCLRKPLSHGISHDNLAFTEFVFERATVTIEFIKPVFHSAIGWCFIAKQRVKFIIALLWW